MMKIYAFLLLSLLTTMGYAQSTVKTVNLPYPDLIPVLMKDSLYGYCDKDLNLKIKPNFEHAELFEEDFKFQIFHVTNPEIIHFGSSDYAWVSIHGERYRINKKGEKVYKYNPKDFKKGETVIYLFRNSDHHIVERVDEKTLLQHITDKHTDKQSFPDEQSLKDFKEKNQQLITEGIIFIYYPKFSRQPFSDFTSESTLLQGIKRTDTGQITIKAKYASIDELYNNPLRINQYPLFIGFRGDLDKYVYVGLNGIEYIINE